MVAHVDTMVESLGAIGRSLLEEGAEAPAMTHVRGEHRQLQQTVIALAAGQSRSFEGGAAEATLLVLRGAVEVASSEAQAEATAFDLVHLPAGEWSVTAFPDTIAVVSWLDPAATGA